MMTIGTKYIMVTHRFLQNWARAIVIAIVAGCLCCAGAVISPVRADDSAEFFKNKIRPMLVEHCDQCHSAEAPEAELAVTALDGSMDESGEAEVWKKIRRMVDSRAMPPKDEDPLSDDKVAAILSWIDETVKLIRPDGWRGVQAKEQVIKAGLYGIFHFPSHDS